MIDTSPVVGAALMAVEILVRQVEWETIPADDSHAAAEVAEFIDGCCHDMDNSWEDFIGEHLQFIPWGWQWYELEYKLREGPQEQVTPFGPNQVLAAVGTGQTPQPSSRYTDGKYGWHRFGLRSQESLLRWEWSRDAHELLGMWQIPAPTYNTLYVPYAKSVNFRTTTRKDNPEGRALDPETPIPTPNGWRRLDDLQPGDTVFDERGRIRYVTARADWDQRPCYRVTFNDGESLVADARHLWYTDTKRDRDHRLPGSVKTTAALAASVTVRNGPVKRVSNHSIPWADALDYPEQLLPLDPYYLGIWLGDGTAGSSTVSCHVADAEETLALIGASAGYTGRVAQNGRPGENGRTLFIRGSKPWDADNPQRLLRTLDLIRNKHIPAAYLRGSIAQRRALLAGLMDSDGYADETGRCEFVNVNRNLVDGVAELVRSLGCRAMVTLRHAAGTPAHPQDTWSVKFTPTFAPFRLARKAARVPTGRTRQQHYITAVESVAPRRTVCIEVDSPSHLFLAGRSLIPTHNSALRNSWIAWKFARNIMVHEGVGVERDLAGLPVAKVPYEVLQQATAEHAAAYQQYKTIVRDIRRDDQEGIVWPLVYDDNGNELYKLELLSTGGSRQFDTSRIISRYEQRQLMTFLADFLMIGTEGPGSRALIDPRINLFSLTGEMFLRQSAATINDRAITQLLAINGIPLELAPKRVPGRVNLTKLVDLASYVLSIAQADAASPLPPDVKQALLKRADLPVGDTGATTEDTEPNAPGEQTTRQEAQAEPVPPPAQQATERRMSTPAPTPTPTYPPSWPDWLVHTTDDLLRERPSDIAPRVWSEIVLGQAAAALARNGTNPTQKRVLEMGQTHSPKRRLAWPWQKRVDDLAARTFNVHQGNPQALRDYYNSGADGQISWGSHGDFEQCVAVASQYIDDAEGFCNERHQEAVGGPPGSEGKR